MDFRDFDPAIARWVVIDPVDHYGQSPYNGYDSNPVFFADPSGANTSFEHWTQGVEEDWDAIDRGANPFDVFRNRTNTDHQWAMHNKQQINVLIDALTGDLGPRGVQFMDKDGDLVGTFTGTTLNGTILIPFDVPGANNINLDDVLGSVGLDDVDTIGISIGFDLTAVMGGGKDWSTVVFLDGEDIGQSVSYETTHANFGAEVGYSVSAVFGNFYDDKNLSKSNYLGTFFSAGGSVYGPISANYFWAPKDGIIDPRGFRSLFDMSKRAWSGISVSLGLGVGWSYSKTDTKYGNP